MTSSTSSPYVSTTTRSSRPRERSGRSSGRTSQTSVERRLSKLAAALNQAWKKSGNRGVKVTAEDLATLWLNDRGRCHYCGIEVDLMTVSFDHVEPLNKGGENHPGNLVACCITCQRSKHTRTPEELQMLRTMPDQICPIDGKPFRPRWADYLRGYGKYCSRRCAGKATRKHGPAQ